MQDDLNFIGKNIRCLRRERGWTIAKLASKIGTSDVVLGRIERSVNAPSALLICRLTEALGVSADALFASEPEKLRRLRFCEEKTPILVQSEACGEPPAEIRRMAREIIEGFQALEDICGAQKRAGIPLSVGFEADAAGIENLALTIRRFMGVEHGVIFDYFELFENMGFRVVTAPFEDSLDSFSYYDAPNQNAFFFVNAKKNAERRLFSLASELGSVLLFTSAMQTGRSPFPSEKENACSDQGEFTMRRAARRFAATFLMPAKAVGQTVSQLGLRRKQWNYELLLRIKHRFGVSAEAFLNRLNELELIDPDLVDPMKAGIREFYRETGFREPDGSKRILVSNGRLGDLVLTGRTVEEAKEEVAAIERTLAGWRVEYQ